MEEECSVIPAGVKKERGEEVGGGFFFNREEITVVGKELKA